VAKGSQKSSKKKAVETRDLSNWKILRKFRQRLATAQAQRDEISGPSPREADPKRKLLEEDYFSLMLFGLLNPVLDSMRGLCAASDLVKMQKEVCTHHVSLGSFSEAQSVFDPEVLKEVFLQLASETTHSWGDPRLASVADQLTLIDGSLIPALPRMHWALWLNDKNRAAKLHLKFKVLKQSACDALLTTGKTCERKTLRKFVKPGEIIVADRYYGLEYGFFQELSKMGASYVIRIRNKPLMEVVEELPLSEADRAAGVTWQGLVKLGKEWQGDPIRVVKIEVDGKELLIVTDLELEAELISLIYRYRWQVELFFKWLKCILKCRHLLAESERGVAIQIYTALIAALLLQGLTGKRPSKRQMEMIQFHLTGYLSLDELIAALKLKKTKD
jgi:hypothetical protein